MTTVQHLGQFQAPSGFVAICDPALVGQEAANAAFLEAPGTWTVMGEYTTTQGAGGCPTLRALVAESAYCNPQTCGPLPPTTITVTSGVLGIVDAEVRAWSAQTAAVPASTRDMPPCVVNAAGIFCRQPPGQYELTIYQNRAYTACDDFLYATKIVVTFVPSGSATGRA